MKALNEELASVVDECSAKDELLQNYKKTAEDAIAGDCNIIVFRSSLSFVVLRFEIEWCSLCLNFDQTRKRPRKKYAV